MNKYIALTLMAFVFAAPVVHAESVPSSIPPVDFKVYQAQMVKGMKDGIELQKKILVCMEKAKDMTALRDCYPSPAQIREMQEKAAAPKTDSKKE